jgi:hypothetical protein
MLEHCDADAAVNGLIAAHHQEPTDHRFLVVTYNLAAVSGILRLFLLKERPVSETFLR